MLGEYNANADENQSFWDTVGRIKGAVSVVPNVPCRVPEFFD